MYLVCKGKSHAECMHGTECNVACAAVSLPLESDVDRGSEVEAYVTEESRGKFDLGWSVELPRQMGDDTWVSIAVYPNTSRILPTVC